MGGRRQPAIRHHNEAVLGQSQGGVVIGVGEGNGALGDDLAQQPAAALSQTALKRLLTTRRQPVCLTTGPIRPGSAARVTVVWIDIASATQTA
jgi:hypothetical protein